jgi:hypothetical protein
MTPLARRTRLVALCLIATPLASGALFAQTFSAGAQRADVVATTVGGIGDTAASFSLNRAQSLHGRMRFADARREYLAAAKKLEAAGAMPCRALWQAAEMYYVEGNTRAAATTLDLVAEKAAAFGHPTMQAKALLEAAILYEQSGAASQATTRLTRLDAVLTSPFVPDSLRSEITARRKS